MASNLKSNVETKSLTLFKIPKTRMQSYKSITSRLHLAKNKLLPIINGILKTASDNASRLPYESIKSYHLTIEQYKDAIWASHILKEVVELLKSTKIKNQFCKTYTSEQFNFDTKNVKINKCGRIYIDTPILVKLIDLHNLLGDIIQYVDDLPAEGINSLYEAQKKKMCMQNKSEGTSNSSDSMEKKKKDEAEKITREILTTLTLPLNTNFIVMSANSVNKSKSKKMAPVPEEKYPPSAKSVHKEKSISEVNLCCGCKLNIRQSKSTGSISSGKQTVVDAVQARKIIIRCLADLDRVKNYLEQDESSINSKSPKQTSDVSINPVNNKNSEPPCICDEFDGTEPLNFIWKEGGENGSKLLICIKGKTEEDGDIQIVIRQCPDCIQTKKSGHRFNVSIENLEKATRGNVTFSNTDEDVPKPQSRESQPCPCQPCPCEGINVLFDPDQPGQSIVEGPQIGLYETINLNLKTGEGYQDLVICLSVKPKPSRGNSGLNIHDLFSESETARFRRNIQVVERVRAVPRTKICSSMELNVDLVKSKLQVAGVKHPNKTINDCLNDLGVYNILRASRPVKCGRMAILNEYQKKSLPYSVSLKSLPLDISDVEIIKQSVDISLNSKDSLSVKNKDSCHVHFHNSVYFLQIVHQRMQFFNNQKIKKINVQRKLWYYIFIEDDIRTYHKTFEVRYFDVFGKNMSPKTDALNTSTGNNLSSPISRNVSTACQKINIKCSSKIPLYFTRKKGLKNNENLNITFNKNICHNGELNSHASIKHDNDNVKEIHKTVTFRELANRQQSLTAANCNLSINAYKSNNSYYSIHNNRQKPSGKCSPTKNGRKITKRVINSENNYCEKITNNFSNFSNSVICSEFIKSKSPSTLLSYCQQNEINTVEGYNETETNYSRKADDKIRCDNSSQIGSGQKLEKSEANEQSSHTFTKNSNCNNRQDSSSVDKINIKELEINSHDVNFKSCECGLNCEPNHKLHHEPNNQESSCYCDKVSVCEKNVDCSLCSSNRTITINYYPSDKTNNFKDKMEDILKDTKVNKEKVSSNIICNDDIKTKIEINSNDDKFTQNEKNLETLHNVSKHRSNSCFDKNCSHGNKIANCNYENNNSKEKSVNHSGNRNNTQRDSSDKIIINKKLQNINEGIADINEIISIPNKINISSKISNCINHSTLPKITNKLTQLKGTKTISNSCTNSDKDNSKICNYLQEKSAIKENNQIPKDFIKHNNKNISKDDKYCFCNIGKSKSNICLSNNFYLTQPEEKMKSVEGIKMFSQKIKENQNDEQLADLTSDKNSKVVLKDFEVSKESLAIFNKFFQKESYRKKAVLRESKKKIEVPCKSQTQFLFNASVKRRPLSERRNTAKQKEKGHIPEIIDLGLSSTRLKRDSSVERTLSKMIVNNFSSFLYESLIRDLSSETKVEILSKIDEFLGQYCRFQADLCNCKCRANKGRGGW